MFALASVVLLAPSVQAQPRQLPLRLELGSELSRCLGGEGEGRVGAVRRIVSLELRGRLADTNDTEVTRADARCGTGARIELEVTDTLTGKVLQRTLDLSAEDPRARPRLLALGLVELVAASWTELRVTPEPSAPSPERREVAPEQRAVALEVARERDPERRTLRAVVLRAGGGARLAADGLALRASGLLRVGAGLRLGARWELALGIELARGSVRRAVDFDGGRFPVRVVLDAITLRTALSYRVPLGRNVWLGPSAALLYGAGRLDASERTQGATNDLGPVVGNLLGGTLGLALGWRLGNLELGLELEGGGWLLGDAATLIGEPEEGEATLARYPAAFALVALSVGWHRALEGDGR
ncbi:MAG: hypothetical protein AAF411_01585 [Myxococcota bacterium]